jgi:hypothetical protein
MKLETVTNIDADRTLGALTTGTIIEVANIDRLCRHFIQYDSPAHNANTEQLTDAEIKLLDAVINYPMQPSTAYIKLAGISPNTLSKIRSNLIEQEYIRQHTVSNTRGRPAQLWEATEKTIQIITKTEASDAR